MSKKTQAPKERAPFTEKGVFPLTRKIMIDGNEIDGLPYDFSVLTVADQMEADAERAKVKSVQVVSPQLDQVYQLMIFLRAVRAEMPTVTYEDLKRMSLKDGAKAAELALVFFVSDAMDGEEETSETPSQTLQ